ncbi:MAG: endonuclease [Bacteroidales bacterium]|nr:endonuclease [Bacteroidales bacterium]MDD3201845.1 endonuclease [Bacteroidales bacterium]
MKRSRNLIAMLCLIAIFASCTNSVEARVNKGNLKLLYWNIQNGMWCGQEDHYDQFVGWVKAQDPDICVWCEAQSIYISGTDKPMPENERYLIENWGELAKRYGHKYWAVGGYRDSYPQVITSKYPITIVKQIIGNAADSVVTHGSGWFQIERNGKKINIVSLHTWPQKYAYKAEDRTASSENNEGDKYRRMEMEYICRHTIGTEQDAGNQLWMMMGDFNSTSRKDNWHYMYADQDTRFLVHDYILGYTPYVDIIVSLHYDRFLPTTGSGRRIDFIYCTPALFRMVKSAEVMTDNYTTPVREPHNLSNFWIPSDHIPIVVQFEIR